MSAQRDATTPSVALAVRAAAEIAPTAQSIANAAGRYIQFKRKRLTAASERSYRAALRDFVRFYQGRDVAEFEPPFGSALIEDFLVHRYGHLAGRTYNRGLSVLCDFMHWLHARGELNRDPTLTLERAKQRQVHRTTFTDVQRAAILATNPDPREQIALRLLLDYGLRKGALRNVQLEHFDIEKHRLVIFTKGEKIHTLPLPDDAVWHNLALLTDEPPSNYLLPKQTMRKRTPPHRKQLQRLYAVVTEARGLIETAAEDERCARELAAMLVQFDLAAGLLGLAVDAAETRVTRELDKQCGDHGTHLWWYRCITRAGVVERGTTSGQRMHKARHTAGQRVLDKTGNLKATQALLCHANIATTGDDYTGWETEQLAETLLAVIPGVRQ